MTSFERSRGQRLDALVRANVVRTYRATLKKDVAAARVDVDAVLVADDPLLATMKAFDLVLAVPGMGKAKADRLFRRFAISPSKTVAGLSARQRGQLVVLLRGHYAESRTYARRRKLAEARSERKPVAA